MKKRLNLILLMILATITCYAQNEKRLALVIGNAEYVGKGNTLRNPVNDANDVSNKLKTLGFDVTTVLNASMLEMDDAIDAFGQKAKNYDVALFYYSGHGLQSRGENYLVPVDAELTTEASIRARCSSINYLLDLLDESGCPMKVVCLDACRDNPFERSKGFSKGLSGIDASKGTLISFATAKGKTADDGDGRNSPYTTAFLNALDQPNLLILDFFNTISNQVEKISHETQIPWTNYSSLNGYFCFNKKETKTNPQPPTDHPSIKGTFSVTQRRKVRFASGNLQYNAYSNSWRIAPNPWDVIGEANENISSSYNGWIDLFGWGGYNPTEISTRTLDYMPFMERGSNFDDEWYTLDVDEWDYVFTKRTTTSGIRYVKATVNGVNGVILLPDDWNSSTFNLYNPNESDAEFGSNTINASQWNAIFSPTGAVFLPAAGRRCHTTAIDVHLYGGYWAATYDSSGRAYYVDFDDDSLYTDDYDAMWYGRSIRLAHPVK